jgi:hypothetical protein
LNPKTGQRLNADLDTPDEKYAGLSYQKPIKDIIPVCRKVIDNMIEQNHKRTWNPAVRRHFNHIFMLMRPHFTERDLSYVSLMGMPDQGNPLFGCRTDKDWKVIYDDYQAPEAVKDWFSIRGELLFNRLNLTDDILDRLDALYLAFLLPYNCECGQGITPQWVSRWAHEFNVTCGFCRREKTFDREDVTFIPMGQERSKCWLQAMRRYTSDEHSEHL